MSNIDCLPKDYKSCKDFSKSYLSYIIDLIKQLDCREIEKFIHLIEASQKNQETIFIIGNGGSAATASHMANDLGMVSKKSGQFPIRALALTDCVPLMTAISNDRSYGELFVEQLKIHYRPGDKLIVISASGNSQNILNAAKWVHSNGGTVIGLIGFDGGKLKELCDVSLHVKTPVGEFGPVEDIHMILDHLITTWFCRSSSLSL